jgi:hypothetical protein
MVTEPAQSEVKFADDVIQEHSYSPGWNLLISIVVAAAFALYAIITFADKHSPLNGDISEAESVLFLKHLAWGSAVIVLAPTIIWVWRSLIKRKESGSRIDLGKRVFVWWDGSGLRVENSLDLDQITRISFVENETSAILEGGIFSFNFLGNSEDIELCDNTGQKTIVRGLCVKKIRDWGRAVKSEFPHISVEC